MAHICVIHDPVGKTLTVYWQSLRRNRFVRKQEKG